ncbi:MAG: hypothetical protein AB8B97_07940 [Granulosicoccus sp.]
MATVKSSICLLTLTTALWGCSGQPSVHDTAAEQDNKIDASAESTIRINDALTPPQPTQLSIEAIPETLIFQWETDRSNQLANLYKYDASNGEETLLLSDIATPINTLSLPSNSTQRSWYAEQFRVELCNAVDCISSDRIAINALAAASSHTLRPAVFVQGERFAESVTVNRDGSLIASSRPVEGAIQIHFHNQKNWVATQPIRLSQTYPQTLLALRSSDTGDTLAVLVRHDNRRAQAGSIIMMERLGEVWLPTNELPVPTGTTLDENSALQFSAAQDHVYLRTLEKLFIYHRGNPGWTLHSSISAPPDSMLAATYVGTDPTRIHALVRRNDSIHLSLYQLANESESPLWLSSHQHLVQGVNADADVFLHRHNDGTSMLIAGWDDSIQSERSPVLWRYASGSDNRGDMELAPIVVNSQSLAPTTISDAELRFSASSDLATVALGWHSRSGDDAQISTYTFDHQEQRYRLALELPHDLPHMAKQGFAKDMTLSADGKTLLVSTLPGIATPSSNRAGELLVLR